MTRSTAQSDSMPLMLFLWVLIALFILVRPPLLNFIAYGLGLGEGGQPPASGSTTGPATSTPPAPAAPMVPPPMPRVLLQQWPPAPARSSELSAVEQEIFAASQDERKTYGKPGLQPDSGLTAAAAMHSRRMADERFLGHTSPDGDGPADRFGKVARRAFGLVAENVAYMGGRAAEPGLGKRFVHDWMNSPDHRRNLLDGRYTHLGVACAETTEPAGDPEALPMPLVYCTQLFLEAFAWSEQPIPETSPAGRALAVRLIPAGQHPPPVSLHQVHLGTGAEAARADLGARAGAAEGTLVVGGPAGLYRIEAAVPTGDPGRVALIPGPYLVVP